MPRKMKQKIKQKIKQIFQNSFYQLLGIYALLTLLASLKLFFKYTLHFEVFALVLAVLGIFIVSGKKETRLNKKLHYFLFGLSIFLLVFFRVIPYVGNNVPLGYDAGIYKYSIDNFNEKGFGCDEWIKGTLSPGFLYLMKFFGIFFSSDFIVKWLFIFFNALLGVSIYFFTKEYFNEKAGIIASLFYAVSAVQFKVFAFLYYKNIIALSLMLWSLYFLKKESPKGFIIFSALTGMMHLPTFFIFGLAYIAFTACNYKHWKVNVLNGVLILALTLVSYTGFFREAVMPLIKPVAESFVEPGNAPGTFISFFTYQFSTLAYLPFAILGFFHLVKKKSGTEKINFRYAQKPKHAPGFSPWAFDMLFLWALINTVIVYFKFFFFNRFIIHLDIALIILASFGFCVLIESKKRLGMIVLALMLFSAGFVTFNEARNAKPWINQEQLELIKQLNKTEENAFVMALSSEYSPFVLAYSGRKTIAPGLFDEDKWNLEKWHRFWKTKDKNETIFLFSVYEKPIYLFAGSKNFENPCFEKYLEKGNSKIYKYAC
jgi:hypothetical protein